MAMYTRELKTFGELSYAHRDENETLVYNDVAPAMEMELEAGQYRELDQRAFYFEKAATQSKFTIPTAHQLGDTIRYFTITPISDAFEFSKVDLWQADLYGKGKAAKMIKEHQEIIAWGLKHVKEKAMYTFVSDNTNFEGVTYYANAATAWSSTGLADMKDDVLAARLVVKGLNKMSMSDTSSIYAMVNETLNQSTVVSGARRDGSVDVNPTVEFLKMYFQMTYVDIASGELIDDSSDPTDTGKSEIWGDKILLQKFSPTSARSEYRASFVKHLIFRPLKRGEANEGWFVLKTETDEEGGVGMEKYATWNYYQYLSHEPTYGYRIDNVY